MITKKENLEGLRVGRCARAPPRHAGQQDLRVPHRRFGRGEPRENKLLQRVAGRKAIMGKKKGEVVEVIAPRGSLKFKIMEIKAAKAGPIGLRNMEWCARNSRLGEASDVLARAFQEDPAWVWLIPDAERRRRLLPWLIPGRLECHGRRRLDDRRASCAARRAGFRGSSAAARRPDAEGARHDAVPASARRLRPSSPTGAPSIPCAPRRCPTRTGTSPGSASTRPRSDVASAPRCFNTRARGFGARRAARGPADEQRGEPSILRAPRIRGRARRRDPERRPQAWAMVKAP